MKRFLSIFVLLLTLGWTACHNAENKTSLRSSKPLTQKELMAFSRKLLRQEKREIDAFIKTQHWKMKESGTGLRYQIISKGNGEKAHTGQIAEIRYSVKLLDGQQIYSGVKSFKIGYGGVESGLEEGILLLKEGDKAKFILPSHLAYGLSGDGDKIPPHTPIIYYVKLLKLK